MDLVPEALQKALLADVGRTKEPTDTSSPKHWAVWLLQNNLTRKFSTTTTTKAAELAALKKFKDVNKLVGMWREPEPGSDAHRILTGVRNLFRQQYYDEANLPRWTVSHAFNLGMVGAGMNVGATTEVLVDKLFNSTLTCTNPVLYKYYVQALSNSRTWRKAERARTFLHNEFRVVKGNNLFYVPKETIIARTAATEPTINMFGQLGYGELLCQVLEKCHGIDLSTQPDTNKWLARIGSSNGSYATIDLSSASDTIGLGLLKFILPERMLADLMLLRSPYATHEGKTVKLNMISTMGNGFTFPLQTLIFANLVLAVMTDLGVKTRDVYGLRKYSVYGDDIICPSQVYESVTSMLGACGFTVNKRKSYATGKFRESCGGDYFDGHPVRAVYLHHANTDAHVYSLINRLNSWSAIHGVWLPKTIAYLRTLVRLRPIPLYEDETAGIRLPTKLLTGRKTSKNGHWEYHALTMRTNPIKPEARHVVRLYHGCKVAVLHGSFGRGGRIKIAPRYNSGVIGYRGYHTNIDQYGAFTPRTRPGEERFSVVKCEAVSHWDFTPDARLTSGDLCNAIERNLLIR